MGEKKRGGSREEYRKVNERGGGEIKDVGEKIEDRKREKGQEWGKDRRRWGSEVYCFIINLFRLVLRKAVLAVYERNILSSLEY